MNDQQTLALWQSVEHWLDNYENPMEARSHGEDCPLCRLYYKGQENDEGEFRNCLGCPIFEATDLENCWDTPWHPADYALHIYQLSPTTDDKPQTLRAIEAEYRFLVELALIWVP